jgi:hypothetical protein
MTASEVFESVTGSGSSDFALLVSILRRHSPWCLIGGLAVNCYVEPVFTLDADVVVVSSQLESIKNDLAGAGFSLQEFLHSLNATMPGSQLRIQLSLERKKDELDLMRLVEAYPELREMMPREINEQVPE